MARSPHPSANVESFGQTIAGEPVSLITLDGGAGLSVEVITFGASSRRVRHHGTDLCLYLEDAAAYSDPGTNPYLGACVGRFANRIASARLSLDGTAHRLSANDDGNTLHGGEISFGQRVWTLADSGVEPELASPASAWVRMGLISKDGDQGFPGRVAATVTYRVSETSLVVSFEATTDAATPVSLTNHAYWNLEGSASMTVANHVVELAASRYVPVNDQRVPLGTLAPVDRTRFDFTTPRPISHHDNDGYDHCLVLDTPEPAGGGGGAAGPGSTAPANHVGLTRAAVVRTDHRSMTVLTDRPGLQFYTGEFLDGRAGGGGRLHHQGTALCLESQALPDAPNQPSFPSAIVRPGELYTATTEYRFADS